MAIFIAVHTYQLINAVKSRKGIVKASATIVRQKARQKIFPIQFIHIASSNHDFIYDFLSFFLYEFYFYCILTLICTTCYPSLLYFIKYLHLRIWMCLLHKHSYVDKWTYKNPMYTVAYIHIHLHIGWMITNKIKFTT